MDDKFTFTLKSPITDEQWDKIMDVDFEHTDRIWFETKHGKVEFVKASAQPDLDAIWEKLSKVYNMPDVPGEALSIIGDVMLALEGEKNG